MSSYSLRNSDQYQTIDTKSQLYYNSFLPSAVRDWNALNREFPSCPSVPSFKRNFSNRQVVPNYYFTGSRIEQILYARLRTNCSCLNYTLFSKHIIKNKFCDCGKIEDTQHFLFNCDRYTAQRQIRIEEVQRHCVPTFNILHFGDMSLNSHTITLPSKLLLTTLKDLRTNYLNIALLYSDKMIPWNIISLFLYLFLSSL